MLQVVPNLLLTIQDPIQTEKPFSILIFVKYFAFPNYDE